MQMGSSNLKNTFSLNLKEPQWMQKTGLDYWDYQSELDKREVPVLSSLSLARARIKKHIKGQVSTPSEANLHGVNILHSSYQAGSTSHISIRSQAESRQAGFYKRKVEVNPKNAFVDSIYAEKPLPIAIWL